MSDKPYLVDANVFIQAKNFHYQFCFCPAFWQWLADGHQAGLIFSSAKVLEELNDGNDDDLVKVWANQLPKGFFVADTHDPGVMQTYRQVMQWNAANTHYRQQAKNEFARFDKADAFLIATAKTNGYTLVTHEKPNPDAKKRIPLPDVANAFNIKNIMIYDLLSRHATGNFSFTP